MARRALKLASWTSVALAASGICLYSNKYLDPNDFGAVRVGRAVATVGSSPFGRGRGAAALLADVHAYSRWTHQSHSSAIHVFRDLCEAPTTQLHCHGGAPPPSTALCPCSHNLCHPEVKHTVGLPGVSVLETLPLQNLPYLILGTDSSGGLLSKHTGKEAFAALIKS